MKIMNVIAVYNNDLSKLLMYTENMKHYGGYNLARENSEELNMNKYSCEGNIGHVLERFK